MENVPFIVDDEQLKWLPAPSIERSISSTRKRSSASDGHGHHVHLRTGAGSDHLTDEKDTQCGHASVYSSAGQTVRLRRCEQDRCPEKRDHECDAEVRSREGTAAT